mgnify:FL=1
MKKNKCLFIHIPRTGGTSILASLGKKKQGGRQHFPWYVYRALDKKNYENFFKFAFVRDPLTRVYSVYKYLVHGGNQKCDAPLSDNVIKYGNFDQFVIHGLGQGHFRNHTLFLPQANFILGPCGETMVDFVGRYENLSDEFQYVEKKLKLKQQLPTLNQSSASLDDEHMHLSHDALKILQEIYKQDRVMFDYW